MVILPYYKLWLRVFWMCDLKVCKPSTLTSSSGSCIPNAVGVYKETLFTFQYGITCRLQPLDCIPGYFVLSPFFLQPIVVILQYLGLGNLGINIYTLHFPSPVNCSDPTPPMDGSIDPYQNTTEGAEILSTCNPGFIPAGRMRAVCGVDGRWNPDPATLVCTCECPHRAEALLQYY